MQSAEVWGFWRTRAACLRVQSVCLTEGRACVLARLQLGSHRERGDAWQAQLRQLSHVVVLVALLMVSCWVLVMHAGNRDVTRVSGLCIKCKRAWCIAPECMLL